MSTVKSFDVKRFAAVPAVGEDGEFTLHFLPHDVHHFWSDSTGVMLFISEGEWLRSYRVKCSLQEFEDACNTALGEAKKALEQAVEEELDKQGILKKFPGVYREPN